MHTYIHTYIHTYLYNSNRVTNFYDALISYFSNKAYT